MERNRREIAIVPFENMDFSQFRESLSAAALIYGMEPSFLSDFYLTCDKSDAEITRKQRDAARVIMLSNSQLAEVCGNLPSLLATNQDIFAGDRSFAFGLSNRDRRIGIMSTYRLIQWEEGLTPSRIQERILKVASHEIGHITGLLHCPRENCLMAHSSRLEEVDAKLPMLCEKCYNMARLWQN